MSVTTSGVLTRSRSRVLPQSQTERQRQAAVSNKKSSSAAGRCNVVSSSSGSYVSASSLVSGLEEQCSHDKVSSSSSERWVMARRTAQPVAAAAAQPASPRAKAVTRSVSSSSGVGGVMTRAMKRKIVNNNPESSVNLPSKRSRTDKVTVKRKPLARASKRLKKAEEVEEEAPVVAEPRPATSEPVSRISFQEWEGECRSRLDRADNGDGDQHPGHSLCQHLRYWREPDSISYR